MGDPFDPSDNSISRITRASNPSTFDPSFNSISRITRASNPSTSNPFSGFNSISTGNPSRTLRSSANPLTSNPYLNSISTAVSTLQPVLPFGPPRENGHLLPSSNQPTFNP